MVRSIRLFLPVLCFACLLLRVIPRDSMPAESRSLLGVGQKQRPVKQILAHLLKL
jgi:hypothetical protein